MRQTNIQAGTMLAGVLLATALGFSGASAQAAGPGSWQFEITPYFLAAAIDATAGVGNIETEIDLSSGDVLENTEAGFMMMAVARRGRWSLGFDGSYFKLEGGDSTSVTGPLGRDTAEGVVTVSSAQWIYQAMAGYRVVDESLKLDLYGGMRYTRLESGLDLNITTTVPAFPGGGREFDAEKDWTDLVVGAHGLYPVNDQWSLIGLADVGTGEDSDLSYQLMGLASWQINDMLAAKFGYRHIYQDFAEDAFSWEVVYSGFIIGLGIAF